MLAECFVAVNEYVLVCNYPKPDKKDPRPSKNSIYVQRGNAHKSIFIGACS